MIGGRQLGGAPGLIDAEDADDVGDRLSGVAGGGLEGARAAQDVADALAQVASVTVFERQRGREATGCRVGIGEDVLRDIGVGDTFVVIVVGVEVEERLDAAGRDAGELDEAAAQRGIVAALVGKCVLPPESPPLA